MDAPRARPGFSPVERPLPMSQPRIPVEGERGGARRAEAFPGPAKGTPGPVCIAPMNSWGPRESRTVWGLAIFSEAWRRPALSLGLICPAWMLIPHSVLHPAFLSPTLRRP